MINFWYIINVMNNKKDLIKNRFEDKYLLKLAILDHIKEIYLKDKYMKATDISTSNEKERLQFAVEKEMMDLKILLDVWAEDKKELKDKRIDKFCKNIKG
jgi:hypothetical protein